MADFSRAIIVVGAGLSGGSAALTALEAGLNVIVVEKEKRLGGNSVRASSGMNAAGTIHQKEQGVKDSVELFAADTAYSAFKTVDAEPTPQIWRLCEESADGVHWLEDHGLHIPVLSQCGGHSAPRTHRPTTGAAGGYLTLGLLRQVKKYEKTGQCKILKQSKMTELLRDSAGRVNGLKYQDLKAGGVKELRGACVIVSTGGFSYNKEMLREFSPQALKLGTTNGPWATGDGMLVARSAGAALIDMTCVQIHPTGFVDPAAPDAHEKTLAAECLRAAGGLLLNVHGHRFTNELGHRDDVTSAENGQKGKIRLVLNDIAREEVAPHVRMYVNHFKVLKEYKNAQELADEMGIPLENLASTFDDYNKAAARGWCASGKPRFPGAPYRTDQPLVVGFVEPVLHYVMGGISINKESEVLATDGKIIPGLYASGETAGGVHGRNRLAGNSLVECVIYGRIAGRNAVKYAGGGAIKSKL
jgi:flavocytochrome c